MTRDSEVETKFIVNPAYGTSEKGRWLTHPLNNHPRRPDRTTLLHLSDLHFRSTTTATDPKLAALLADILTLEQPPDLVFCTGDVVDGAVSDAWSQGRMRTALENGLAFLKQLCARCELEPASALFVVPGNHDYRTQGILRDSLLRTLFNEYFGTYFRSAVFPDLGVAICSFDSNSSDWNINAATGWVQQQEFIDLAEWVGACRKSAISFDQLTKIALLHHHPMPITETEHSGEKLIGASQFMILRNAATFITEALKADVELILHGHQHVVGYSSARFPFAESERSVAVVAAGSATKPNEGRYCSYNVITIAKEKPIEIQQRILREGTYLRTPSFIVPASYGEWRQAKARRFSSHQEILVTGIAANIEAIIDPDGDSSRTTLLTGVRALGAEYRNTIPLTQFSIVGTFEKPEAFCLNDRNQHVGVVTPPPGSRYEIEFHPPLNKTDALDLEIKRRGFNTFFFYAQDRRDVLPPGSTTSTEKVGWRVTGLFKSFCLNVRLPPGARWSAPRVEVNGSDNPGPIDRSESDYCTERLSCRTETSSIHLTVEDPLPWHDYWIVWDLPDEPRRDFNAATVGDIETIQQKWFTTTPSLSNPLLQLRGDIAATFGLSQESGVDIALMAFDAHPDARCLRVVAGLYPDGDPFYAWTLRKGQGIAGQSLRRRRDLICFSNDSLWEHYYVQPPGTAKDRFVLASPLTYPLNSDNVVCLIRLGCRSAQSEILQIQQDDGAQQRLSELVHTHYVKSLLPALLGKKRVAVVEDNRVVYRSVEELLA